MPANVALTPTELANLAKQDQLVPYYLSYKKENAIATATVSADPSGASYAVLSVTSATGWTDIHDGMSAKITSSDGLTLRGYYRVRGTQSDTTLLNIEEIAPSDQSIIAQSIRISGIVTGDLITVTDRYDLFSMKPRIANGFSFQDYGVPVGTHNSQPEVVVNVTINSEPGDYITTISSDGGTQAITATVTVTKWATSSGSTLSYAWTAPASWSSLSGTTSATLTGNAPPGDYELYCTVTDSIAGPTEIARWVRIHSPSDPPLGVNVTSDTRDMNSAKMSIRAIQAVIGVVPPGSKVALWSNPTWGGSDVATATKKFIGFLYQQPFTHEPNYYETNADIYSTAAILAERMCYPATLKYTGSTSTWEELPASLQNIQFVMWWVLRWRCANLLKCFNFTPFTTSSGLAQKTNIGISQGSVFAALQTLADAYDVNVGSRSDGEIISQYLPWMLLDRSGVATRCTLTNSIYSDVKVTWVRQSIVGSVIHDGISSDLTADIAVAAQAPGLQIFGQGGRIDKRSDKVYENQGDALARVGNSYAYQNSQYPQIELDILNNWDVFECADCNIVTVVVPADKSPTGSALTIDCVPQTVAKTWIGGQRAKIKLTLVASTQGTLAQAVPPQPTSTLALPPSLPALPPQFPMMTDVGGSIPLPTPLGQVAKLDGNELLAGKGTAVYWVKNFIEMTTPQHNNITPNDLGAFQVQAVLTEPNPTVAGPIGGYVLGLDAVGTQSAIWHSGSVTAISPTWTMGTTLGDNFAVLRGAAPVGNVLAYAPSHAGSLVPFNFVLGSGGFGLVSRGASFSPQTAGTYQTLQGWSNTFQVFTGSGFTDDIQGIDIALSPGTLSNVVGVKYLYNLTQGAFNNSEYGTGAVQVYLGGTQIAGTQIFPAQNDLDGTHKLAYIVGGPWTIDEIRFQITAGVLSNTGTDPGGDALITYAEIDFGGGSAKVIYSNDYGATNTGAITVGDSPGAVGGFDVNRNSGVSFAAGSGTVCQATTLGASYSPFYTLTGSAQCVACHIPYINWAGADQTASSAPDVIVALNQADGSGRSLLWIEGNGSTLHDLTPTAGMVFDNANCVTTHMGTHIACFGLVGNDYKVYQTDSKGSAWHNVTPGTLGNPTVIHNRRNNITPTRGQLYLSCDAGIYYSSYFAKPGNALQIRYLPGTITTLDSVW